MITDEIRKAIQKRADTDDEWDYGVELCYNEEIEILSRNISETIEFLENECTADEFSWLSEIFDEIIENTLSVEIINTLRIVAQKYPYECKKYNISYCIDMAESRLEYLLNEKKPANKNQ